MGTALGYLLLLTTLFSLTSCVTQPAAPIEYGNSSASGSSINTSSSGDDSGSIVEKKSDSHESWRKTEDEEQKQEEIVVSPVRQEIAIRSKVVTHEVIEGETLESIAKQYGISEDTIIVKNNLKEPYRLEELQILLIPPQQESPVAVAVATTTEAAAPAPHMPLEGNIISKFGEHYNGSVNQGINIAAPLGTNVESVNSGIVVHAGNDAKFGNLVIIKSDSSDIFIAYAHMNDLMVTKGENIADGQIIGHVGQSGNVTKPQLHFAVRSGKMPIDPMGYVGRQ